MGEDSGDQATANQSRDETDPAEIGYSSRNHIMPMIDGVRALALQQQAAPAGAHLTYYGGPVLQHVKVVQVNWGTGVNFASQFASFYTAIVNSTYMDWLSEYNTTSPAQSIGRGTFVAQVTDTKVSTSSSITDAQIQTEISARISDGTFPAPDADTIYMVHFPPGKTITASDGSKSCQVFCAYHGTYLRNGSNVYYGVIPDQGGSCAGGCGSDPSTFNNSTSVASHELIEAVTDAAVGLATVLGPPLAWYDNTNGEIGDICNAQQGSVSANGQTWVVQTEFSNAQNNCVVSGPSTPPPPTNDFSIAASPASLTVAAGASGTVTVSTAVTSGSAGTVSLSATGLPSGVTASFSPSSVTAGGSSTLTLTAASTAASATATVAIKGTEGTVSHTANVALTVNGNTPPPPPPGQLANGVPVTGLSGAKAAQLNFTFVVPAGATNVNFKMSGGSGDADIYLKFGSAPTLSSYDYRPYITGNNETVTYPNPPKAGTYYIMINGYTAFSGVSLVANYTVGTPPPPGNVLTNGVPVSNLSGAMDSWQYFTIAVPAGATNLKFKISGGSGDCDLYVRFNAQPDLNNWDFRPWLTGNSETVSIAAPKTGTYYVGLNGYLSYSGVTLVASYTP